MPDSSQCNLQVSNICYDFGRALSRESYRFRADLYGTSWYHSHYSAQLAGGLLGPMIIYGPTNYDYDIDLGPVFLTDCKDVKDM